MDEIKIQRLQRERSSERQYIILSFLQSVRRKDEKIFLPSKSFTNAIIEVKLLTIEDHNFVLTRKGLETLYELEDELIHQKQYYHSK
jgi:hypothetical protein